MDNYIVPENRRREFANKFYELIGPYTKGKNLGVTISWSPNKEGPKIKKALLDILPVSIREQINHMIQDLKS